MPSGKVHDFLTIAGAAAAAPAWWFLTPSSRHELTVGATLVAATLFSGLMLSPDLDLESGSYYRWGPLRYMWLPYRAFIPHRSPLSHSLVVGPALRIVYFLAVVWVVLRGVTWLLDSTGVARLDGNVLTRQYGDAFVGFWRAHPAHFEMSVIGILIGAGLHVGADLIVSACKPKRRRRR